MRLPVPRLLRRLTIQSRIALLVIACILPGWLLFALDTYLYYERERSIIRQRAVETARGLLRVVERDLAANVAALQTLATSSQIDRRDLAAFYREAKEALGYTSGFTIVLTDASGQQLMNLLRPFGSALPRHGNPELLQRALTSRKAIVSDVYIGGVTGKPLVGIEVPVIRDGHALYGLALGIDPDHLADILRLQGLPGEWVVQIFDGTGTILARDRAAEQYVGRKGSAPLLKRMQEVPEDIIEVPTLEGIPVMAAFSRSTTYGWSVAIGVPEAILTAELRRSLTLDTVGASLLLLLGLGLAALIGRGIARPIQQLIAPALAIGKDEAESLPPLGLKEADEVRQAIVQARQLLREREREREKAESAERQMQIAKEVAEQANEAKARFLATMSHELRSPLNAILGFSRLMRNAADATAEQVRNLDIIARSGEHLLSLINNVLEISKIEAGYVELREIDLDLHQVLHELQSLMQMQAAGKGLVFTLSLAADLPRHVIADAAKLRQVLINLVANAIKFTQNGSVFLRAKLAVRESSQRARVRFEVEDSGPGISEIDKKRIFAAFVQLDRQSPAEAGTGLGLAISKQYVELMGGVIGVCSEPGKGSLFHFEVPVAVCPVQSPAHRAVESRGRISGLAPDQPRYRLLIAEDQPENRLLLNKLLAPLGFELRDAANGREAVALAEQWRPHLIWMDIRMPVMDGLDATRRIKASAAGERIKVVALTAQALEDERREILAAGCDDFIRKPYRDGEIFDALERHLGLRWVYAESAPRAAAGMLPTAQLRRLAPALLAELRQAAILLDAERCLEIVRRVDEIDAELGARLAHMIEELQYKELLELLPE